jgi:predicted amidophosphoribosyltransferase
MKKLVVLMIIVAMCASCAPNMQKQVVYVPETLETNDKYYRQVHQVMSQLIDERAHMQKMFLAGWLHQILKAVQQNAEQEQKQDRELNPGEKQAQSF